MAHEKPIEQSVGELVSQSRSRDPHERQMALTGLASISRMEVIMRGQLGELAPLRFFSDIYDILVNALTSDPDPNVRATAISGFGDILYEMQRLGIEIDPEIEDGFLDLMQDANPKIRRTAARALRRIGSESAPPRWRFW